MTYTKAGDTTSCECSIHANLSCICQSYHSKSSVSQRAEVPCSSGLIFPCSFLTWRAESWSRSRGHTTTAGIQERSALPLAPCVMDTTVAPSVHTTTGCSTSWIGRPTFFTSQLGAQDHQAQQCDTHACTQYYFAKRLVNLIQRDLIKFGKDLHP
jgi:hypothetical protein